MCHSSTSPLAPSEILTGSRYEHASGVRRFALFLYDSSGTTILDSVSTGPLHAGVSFGRTPSDPAVGPERRPTPGAGNVSAPISLSSDLHNVRINELALNRRTLGADGFGAHEGYVELFNDDSLYVDLNGASLQYNSIVWDLSDRLLIPGSS